MKRLFFLKLIYLDLDFINEFLQDKYSIDNNDCF